MILAALASAFICAQAVQVDGDTLKCRDGVRVRLWGVNSPEKGEPGSAEATRALSRLVFGKTLTCEPKGRSYNRVVALCKAGSTDIAAEMIRQGHAREWVKYSKGAYSNIKPGRVW